MLVGSLQSTKLLGMPRWGEKLDTTCHEHYIEVHACGKGFCEGRFSHQVKTLSDEKVKRKDSHSGYRVCPIPSCKSKPQKRLAENLRICHPKLSPSNRKALCRMARGVPKSFV